MPVSAAFSLPRAGSGFSGLGVSQMMMGVGGNARELRETAAAAAAAQDDDDDAVDDCREGIARLK